MSFERKLLKEARVKSFTFSRFMNPPSCIGCGSCSGVLTMNTPDENNNIRTVIGGYFCRSADDFVEPPAYCPQRTEKMP